MPPDETQAYRAALIGLGAVVAVIIAVSVAAMFYGY